jgi:hypothetical protein
MQRIADMLCTAHNIEGDRYKRYALILDILIMLVSLYLVSMVFVDPALDITLTPLDWDSRIWTGSLATGVFALSVVQLLVNWKGRSDAHERSFGIYSEAKSNCIELLNGKAAITREDYNRVRARYDFAADIGCRIPDGRFLKLKKKHLIKIEISRILDEKPGIAFIWVRAKLWWRDNFCERKDSPRKG